jgi:hypothetical protein
MSFIIEKNDLIRLINELLPNVSESKKQQIYEKILSSISNDNENINVLVDIETLVREILLENSN